MKHLLPLLILLLTGCVTQETEDNTPMGNFDALWSSLDSHYCFFAEKKERHGLDWNEARQRYRQMVTPGITNRQLFEVLANLTCELRDGHVNLYAAHQTARYARWYDDYPMNYSDCSPEPPSDRPLTSLKPQASVGASSPTTRATCAWPLSTRNSAKATSSR